jgi:ABC-type arginine/histidine transport system permease subunit
MLWSADLWVSIAGTVVLWATSGVLTILLALILAAGSLSPQPALRIAARVVVNSTRGVPTSLLVVAAGIGMMRLARAPELPVLFPGTLAAFQHVAWGIMLALALGSAGHLAEIFRAARSALGRPRLEQAQALGLSRVRRAALLARESAAIALAPVGARLVHHLHNTAFAALFPVADLFGYIHGQSTETFRVLEFAALGCALYVTLSGLTWLLVRTLEALLVPRRAQTPRRAVVAWS